jgi:hypothetical protein
MKKENELPVVNNPEVIKNDAEQKVEGKEADPFAKGRERMASINEFLAKTKEKASSVVSRVGGSLSRFWNRTKSFGGEAVAATLSADVLAKKGYNAVEGKVVEAGKFVGKKGTEAVDFAGQKINQAGEWAGEKGTQFAGFVGSNYEKAATFTKDKAEQVKSFAKDKVELGKDIAFYTKEKTKEGLLAAKNGVENRYNKVKTFGENSFAAAKMEMARVKDAYRQKMNAIRVARLQAEYNRVAKEESATSQKAEKLRLQRESLAEKMGLLQSLEAAA